MDMPKLKHRFIIRPLIFQVFGLLKRPFQVWMVALFAVLLMLWVGSAWVLLLKRNIVELVDILGLPYKISGDEQTIYKLAAPALVYVHLGLSVLELATNRPLFRSFGQKMKWATGLTLFLVGTLALLIRMHPEAPAALATDTGWMVGMSAMLIVMTLGASAWAFAWGTFFDRIRDGIVERMNPQRAEEGSNSPG